MNVKRIVRAPMVWILLLCGFGLVAVFFSGGSGFSRIDTSAAEKLITSKEVDPATRHSASRP